MINENLHLYLYMYEGDSNFRKVTLLPKGYVRISDLKLNQLEGIIFTQKAVPKEDLRFPITKEDEILKKYGGEKIEFRY